ncbi:ABC transporter ATP-binding protein [Treponema sp. OMZ 840]|uniref:ABC transporter ATP-binding protein n=1 Tax=Treponema sp. OMZ 840 TaxID=244313 RepID=UPI003D8D737A
MSDKIMEQAASINFQNIVFSYPGAGSRAIDDVSIDVNPGELVVFVGPSGCGKSTLLKTVAGLIIPNSGHLLIDGMDSINLAPEKRQIGWVPQSYALFEHYSIEDNVGFGLKMRKIPRAKRMETVYELLELCRIKEMAKRPVGALSGGQRQRVAIARALAVKPRVMLLDEPLAALDPQLRIALRADLEELLRKTGITTLFVTHDQSEALAIADKVVILRSGKVEQIGSPDDLWNYPANPFVAEFLSNALFARGQVIALDSVKLPCGIRCKTKKPVSEGVKEVTVVLRKNRFEISPNGVKAQVVFSEYSGGTVFIKAKTVTGEIIPATSVMDIAVGQNVLINIKTDGVVSIIED